MKDQILKAIEKNAKLICLLERQNMNLESREV